MTLNAAGLTALLNDGNDAAFYAAAGDGPTAADQTSNGRVLVTWAAPAARVIQASNVPLAFTGSASGVATHALLFSAASGGTFYGFVALGGDTAFNEDGEFQISALSITLADADAPPEAPLVPYVLGAQVGPPAGATLTTGGLGSPDSTESYTITVPASVPADNPLGLVPGEQNTFDVQVFYRRRFTSTVGIPTLAPGVKYLLRQCLFDVPLENFCLDAENVDVNGINDFMEPSLILEDCAFDGSDSTGKSIVGGHMWLIRCHLGNTEDGWSGVYWSVAIDSNLTCTTDGLADPHSDGVQSAGIGKLMIHHCFTDSGQDAASSNAPIRIGTEFSAVDGIGIYYTSLSGSQHGLQMRGDAGAGNITNVDVRGCRWLDTPIYGETDFQEVSGVTWVDNLDAAGDPIPNPVP